MIDINWEFVFSCISIIIAFIAIFQSKNAIDTSNKQFLFDRRVNCYLLIDEILKIANSPQVDKNMLVNNDYIYSCVNCGFWLTNSNTFECVQNVFGDPMNSELHLNFMKKVSEIRNEAEIIQFLFSKNYSREVEYMTEFILSYINMLEAFMTLCLFKYELEHPQNESVVSMNARINNNSEYYKLIDKKMISQSKKLLLQEKIETFYNNADIMRSEEMQNWMKNQLSLTL